MKASKKRGDHPLMRGLRLKVDVQAEEIIVRLYVLGQGESPDWSYQKAGRRVLASGDASTMSETFRRLVGGAWSVDSFPRDIGVLVLFSLKGLHRLEVDSEELREALEEVELIGKDCPDPECESERQYVGPFIEGEHRIFRHPTGEYDTWEEVRAPLGGEEYMSFAAD